MSGPGMLYFRCKTWLSTYCVSLVGCRTQWLERCFDTCASSFNPHCLCLSDETLKKSRLVPSTVYGVYVRGSKISHTGGKCVTCYGLHIPV